MIQMVKPTEETKDSSSPNLVNPSKLPTMDIRSPKYLQPSSLFPCNKEPPLEGNSRSYYKNKRNPFADTFPDPLCKLNLKETSEFVKAFPMANNDTEGRGFSAQSRREGISSVAQRRPDAPPTPGRPVFSFAVGNLSRKSFPSKWDDAEKWLISSSCHDSPAHAMKPSENSNISKQNEIFHQNEVFAEKCRVTEEKVSRMASSFHGSVSLDHPNLTLSEVSTELLLKDKFTDSVGVDPSFPNFRCCEPTKEGFLFSNTVCETMKNAATEVVPEVQHRDIGTEMTPRGSSTTSRCHTPFKSSSPVRHNTPADRSGPLALGDSRSTTTTIDISELQEYHFAKLELGTQYDSVVSNWSSREEEEEEISKSLRHFETGTGFRKSAAESRASAWEEEERAKCCIRYQREEAKIQAWVNLQSAKVEAQSRKLEVKIQKMRSNLEEKLMKRMAVVHRKAEEWRAAAQLQHSQQNQRVTEQAQKMKNQENSSYFSDRTSCGCFPCNNHQL
ncbi:PREDICTED: uncharacterized protein LOC104609258 [Nelumbo nucifera]|uniref:Remorin C-terminal domain-containing protein n=2 Tax=Nelumbo nucifera TaxID=4432 RepID=A0A822ZW12_NELNU|nr:PREDICTED: uncharacterized protein LOC104609258 [Nelumbo nucifera]DAD49193.1 TPA_asm: hypothetical protein HUJ06_019130 [Nelumbo nucifera]